MSEKGVKGIVDFAKGVREDVLHLKEGRGGVNLIGSVRNVLDTFHIEYDDHISIWGELFKVSKEDLLLKVERDTGTDVRRYIVARNLGHAILDLGYLVEMEKFNKLDVDENLCLDYKSLTEYNRMLGEWMFPYDAHSADIFATALMTGKYRTDRYG